MSAFTNFLNLFKWNALDDAEEEFDIEKALNENWDKIDNKMQQHVNNTAITHANASLNQNGFMSKEDKKKLDNIANTYNLNISTTSNPGTNITIPCHYKVGANVLDVYINGEKLIRSSDNAGTNGHYLEVGTAGSISNIIKSTTDWQFEAGDVLELIVRGDYE